MRIWNFILAFLISCLFMSCADFFFKDDELTIERTNYIGNQLRIDGYYYKKYGNPEKLTIYFLYKNGIFLFAGDGYELSKMNEFEENLKSQDFIDKLHGIKFSWGVFKVENTSIQYERLHPPTPLEAFTSSGEILNDTTFQITKSWRSKKEKKVSEVNETYHFKKFSPKPDSTNTYIK